ncbi:SDR family oxidoreductase [Arthrobacter sp. JUb115]|uniref:SDR family NAD(P)-dependent oxidoreductase n=1 Tax=Arthrobacter sp. JUb115 TaxID=2485108 RepID=UPI00105C80C5|nr:SDR family oxidoreductase [Arthrobacter sp. JUb115]TDU22476.1 3-oxoacyl-[acyl-carrier protein] reductase [Arthrobacter sp. JUb115]
MSISMRSVIVTGAAGGGTGAEICRAFAAEGLRVYANGKPGQEPEIERLRIEGQALSGEIIPAIFDVSDPDEVQSFFECLDEDQRGRITTLVHNAAPSNSYIGIDMLDQEVWFQDTSTILNGAFHLTKACIPAMKNARWGRVIYISSNAAFRGAYGRSASYVASKSALIGLSNQVALELAAFNVTSNVVAPSQIDTPRARRGGRRDDNSMAAYASHVPLGRVACTRDVADLAVFLASEAANYITAQTIRLDGGAKLASASTRPKQSFGHRRAR